MKVRIHKNRLGGVNGFVGKQKVIAFGDDPTAQVLREWIMARRAEGYALGTCNVSILLPEETRRPERSYNILFDGKPVEIVWARSRSHALAIMKRRLPKGKTAIALERDSDACKIEP